MSKISILIFALTAIHVRSDAPTPAPAPAPAPAPTTTPPATPGPAPPPCTGPPAAPAPPSQDKPSIKLDNFDVFKDCDELCDELKPKWCKIKDPKVITKILCHRSWDQRKQIQETFPSKCDNRVLAEKIGKITFMLSDCTKLMIMLLTAPIEIKKQTIDEEKCNNNDDDVITQLICSSTNKEKTELNDSYPNLKQTLEEYGSKGGDGFKNVLTGACLKQRAETPDPKVTPQEIETVANDLIAKNGPIEFTAKLKEVIDKYSDPDLQKIFLKYQELKKDGAIADKISTTFQGKEMEAYLVLVRSIENKYAFWARALNHCIKGGEINSNLKCVNRIVVLRCEVDLGNIAESYNSIFNKKFDDDLKFSCNIDGEYLESIRKLLGDYE